MFGSLSYAFLASLPPRLRSDMLLPTSRFPESRNTNAFGSVSRYFFSLYAYIRTSAPPPCASGYADKLFLYFAAIYASLGH